MEVVTRCPARSHDAASPMTIAPMPQLPRTVNVFVPASPTRAEIVAGLRITAPVAAGYIPLGLAYGLLVVQLGLPWWMAPALSLAAYSGSAELLVVTLASHNTPLAVIAVTMLLVNFRLIFFAFSFPLHVIEGRVARLLSMYALVDEAYALTALFITLTLDASRSARELPSVALAGIAFAVAMALDPAHRLLVALLLFVAFLSGRHLLRRRGLLPLRRPNAAPVLGTATDRGIAR